MSRPRLSGAAERLLERSRSGPVALPRARERRTGLVLAREGLCSLTLALPGKREGEVAEHTVGAREYQRDPIGWTARVARAWTVVLREVRS